MLKFFNLGPYKQPEKTSVSCKYQPIFLCIELKNKETEKNCTLTVMISFQDNDRVSVEKDNNFNPPKNLLETICHNISRQTKYLIKIIPNQKIETHPL